MFTFLTEAAANPAGSMMTTLLLTVGMLVVFWFILIRPENKRKKEAEQMRAAIKVGDKITTIGGVVGTIVSIKDNNIVIETSADQVRVEFAKWAISTNDTADAAAKEKAKKAQEERAKAAKKAAKNK